MLALNKYRYSRYNNTHSIHSCNSVRSLSYGLNFFQSFLLMWFSIETPFEKKFSMAFFLIHESHYISTTLTYSIALKVVRIIFLRQRKGEVPTKKDTFFPHKTYILESKSKRIIVIPDLILYWVRIDVG